MSSKGQPTIPIEVWRARTTIRETTSSSTHILTGCSCEERAEGRLDFVDANLAAFTWRVARPGVLPFDRNSDHIPE